MLRLLLLLLAAPAAAHGIETTVQGDGRVSVLIHDTAGAPLAHAAASVYAPGAGQTPAWTGATDADGRLSFTAPRDGAWRVDLIAGDGHVDRAFVRVANGVPATGGTLPRWLLAVSLTGNLLAFLLVLAPRLGKLARHRHAHAATRNRP